MKLWRTFSAPKKVIEDITKSLKTYSPDILALVETDLGSFRVKSKSNTIHIKERLDMINAIEKVKYSTDGAYQILHKTPIFRKQANAILSKHKLENEKFHFLSAGTKRLVIEATIKINDKKVTLLLTHLSLRKNIRKKQILEIIDIVNSIENPVILMGDFNTFEGFGELDILIRKTKLNWKANSEIVTYTYPSHKPKKTLDYILTSEEINVKDYQVLKLKHSDHLPLIMDFEIK